MPEKEHAHIEIMGINPAARGKGLAKSLLSSLKSELTKQKNISKLTLSVNQQNKAGINSFLKEGKPSKLQNKENYINFEI